MSASNNDGGPAFPISYQHLGDQLGETIEQRWPGMSLRDYFAACAPMQTLPSNACVDWTNEIRIACEEMGITREESNYDEDALGFWCQVEAFRRYRYADAMLRAREASNG